MHTDNREYTVLCVMGSNHKLCQYLIIMLLYNLQMKALQYIGSV